MSNFSFIPPFIQPPTTMSQRVQLSTLTKNRLIPHEDVFVVAHQMDRNVPKHSHDYYECVLISQGIVINQSDGHDLYLLPNSLLLMNLNSSHALKMVDPNAVVVNLGLRPKLFQAGIFHDFFQAANPVSDLLRGVDAHSYLYYPFPKSARLGSLIDELLSRYAANGFKESYAVDAFVLLVLDELCHEQTYSYAGIDQLSYRLLQYIQAHYATVSLQGLAETFNFNPSYLSRHLKQHFGMSTNKLITTTRMKAACNLLVSTNKTIEEIATATGYSSTSHFFRVFKAQLGMTPSDYRQANQHH